MRKEDIAIIGAAALAAWWIISRAKPAPAAPRRTALQIPPIFTPGGGWMPDGSYDAKLLDRQYAEGWGYGD